MKRVENHLTIYTLNKHSSFHHMSIYYNTRKFDFKESVYSLYMVVVSLQTVIRPRVITPNISKVLT